MKVLFLKNIKTYYKLNLKFFFYVLKKISKLVLSFKNMSFAKLTCVTDRSQHTFLNLQWHKDDTYSIASLEFLPFPD